MNPEPRPQAPESAPLPLVTPLGQLLLRAGDRLLINQQPLTIKEIQSQNLIAETDDGQERIIAADEIRSLGWAPPPTPDPDPEVQPIPIAWELWTYLERHRKDTLRHIGTFTSEWEVHRFVAEAERNNSNGLRVHYEINPVFEPASDAVDAEVL
ncbi:MAG: hypothetical protein HC919_05500 [Oscillatoriales cyanobacterium SM2_2_1]|nr:hypothetical protein [Oscillatoriales cyanobacterium SM2_2_1]